MKVFAEAEQSAVPAAVAKSVLTWKLLRAEEGEEEEEVAVLDEETSATPVDNALLIDVEPKVSCTSASIAS